MYVLSLADFLKIILHTMLTNNMYNILTNIPTCAWLTCIWIGCENNGSELVRIISCIVPTSALYLFHTTLGINLHSLYFNTDYHSISFFSSCFNVYLLLVSVMETMFASWLDIFWWYHEFRNFHYSHSYFAIPLKSNLPGLFCW